MTRTPGRHSPGVGQKASPPKVGTVAAPVVSTSGAPTCDPCMGRYVVGWRNRCQDIRDKQDVKADRPQLQRRRDEKASMAVIGKHAELDVSSLLPE